MTKEKIDEMKNKISMELQNPITQQGFEIICKHLEELEKQNETHYVILNMNIQYEICRRCPKSGLFKGTYKECEAWIKGATEATKELQEDLEHKKIAIKTRNKRIKDLEKQIEKMKNWCNCGNYQDCLIQRAEEGKGLKAEECHNCDKWRLSEKKNNRRKT